MSEWVATIGLEIHAELKTRTKMFCSSLNDPDETRPNVNVCPVCLAHPGTLPVVNREAVRSVLRVGSAIGARLADYSEFDRKNYFYPDLPKGYQISQFEFPLVSGGLIGGVPITRIHLEEDTASSIHNDEDGTTLIDYNRGGVPLMELVTEPEMHSAAEAAAFAKELQLLLRYLDVSNANMEKGEMRVEANVSVAPKGERSATYVEIKNLNSFRTMERAVEYEIKRQIELKKAGGTLSKQTLGWDDTAQKTFPQRQKEGSADYRYFPDPDIPSIRISEIDEMSNNSLAISLPELPWARRGRYIEMGVKEEDAELYVREKALGDFFDDVVSMLRDMGKEAHVVTASNYLANDGMKHSRDNSGDGLSIPISAAHFASLMSLVKEGRISSRAAKDLLAEMWQDPQLEPEKLAEEKGLLVDVSSDALAQIVQEVLKRNSSVASDYKGGKLTALEFLLGQCMKELKGAGNPADIRAALTEALKE